MAGPGKGRSWRRPIGSRIASEHQTGAEGKRLIGRMNNDLSRSRKPPDGYWH